ncbi:MAG: glycogen-binding domain-containing protein, partial [bacterium]|nr:glycogen-binding domain-containing protein [bacterium]
MRHRPLLSSLAVLLAGIVLAAGSLPAADVTFVHRAPGAKEVTLAGSFNGWKAFDLALKDTGGGVWAVVVPLDEGTYEYKFVVDGAWRQDPTNPDGKDDGYGGQNSVVVVPAGAAKLTAGGGEAPAGLKATPVATAVAAAPAGTLAGTTAGTTVFSHNAGKGAACFLAGEFNGWNPTADRMEDPDGDGTFTKALTLAPGRYMYKFVVDGNWLADPAATESAEDGFGGKNSVAVVGTGVAAAKPAAAVAPAAVATAAAGKTRFSFDAGGKVGGCFLAGEFNSWNPTGQGLTDPDGDGVYTADVELAPGRYMYKFVVDGNWKQDPQNPEAVDDGFGGKNSVITVGAGGAAVAPAPAPVSTPVPAPAAGGAPVDVTFTYTPVISGVQNVFLAGSFNGWSDAALRLTDPENDGTYSAVVPLAPGNHQYKFVVDGNWQQDPGNAAVESDGFGGNNSLVVVKAGAAPLKAAESAAVRAATGT